MQSINKNIIKTDTIIFNVFLDIFSFILLQTLSINGFITFTKNKVKIPQNIEYSKHTLPFTFKIFPE